jgi:hypothetical protein
VVSFGDYSEEQISTSNNSKATEDDVLQEEWCKIHLGTVQNLYKSIPRRIAAVLKAKGGPTPY